MLTSPRQFGTMTEKVAEYEKLLNTLMPRVSDADASLIRLALERVQTPQPDPFAPEADHYPLGRFGRRSTVDGGRPH